MTSLSLRIAKNEMLEQNLRVHDVCWQRVGGEVAEVFGKEATQSRGGKLSENHHRSEADLQWTETY